MINGGINEDILWGRLGNDTLNGGINADQLAGGLGKDLFVYRFENGKDRILDFIRGQDKIDVTSFDFADFADFTASVSLNRSTINFGGGNTLQLFGVQVANLTASDSVFA